MAAHPAAFCVALGCPEEWMDEFASRFDNKIDAKGRVSIPASFRAVLAKEGAEDIFCYPHLDRPALEAGGSRLVEKIKGILEDFPIDSPERDEIATAYFGSIPMAGPCFQSGSGITPASAKWPSLSGLATSSRSGNL
jgi:hypothetical protein